jgi:predicted amidohydrolase
MRSGIDMARNLADASSLVRQAAGQGAQYVLTPEVTNIIEADKERTKAVVRRESDDSSVAGFSALAAELGLSLRQDPPL